MKRIVTYIKKDWLFLIASGVVLVLIGFIDLKLYTRIGAFGCFDDCHTITTAYFMTRGREIYSQIFYNHQVLMPVLSLFIQTVLNPITSLYELIAIHRITIMLISFIFSIALLARFRWSGVIFLLWYEPIKFYLFGDRFLAESLVAYLAAYLAGLVFLKLSNKKLYSFDYGFAAALTWLIIFLREPYIPLAGIMFLLIIFENNFKKIHYKSIGLFVGLSIATLLLLPVNDFIQTVFVQNIQTVGSNEIAQKNLFGIGIIELFFYPFIILYKLPNSLIGQIQMLLSGLFIGGSVILGLKYKKYWLVSILWLLLGISAIRYEDPGYMFFEAFHMIPWYTVLIMYVSMMLVFFTADSQRKEIKIGTVIMIIIIVSYLLFSPQSFLQENIDTAEEFNTNYGRYQKYASVISQIAETDDTLFVDLWDDILYWNTNMDSAYQYALYTPWNKSFSKYETARSDMYKHTPPNIYYCSDDYMYKKDDLIPMQYVNDYIQLSIHQEPVCVKIHKNTFNRISDEKWNILRENGIDYLESVTEAISLESGSR